MDSSPVAVTLAASILYLNTLTRFFQMFPLNCAWKVFTGIKKGTLERNGLAVSLTLKLLSPLFQLGNTCS